MPNTLGNYNETYFAQQALIQLEKALGIASRVHRDYERSEKNKGDTIQIRRPSVFTVNNAPATAEDLSTESVSIVFDQWKEVKFKLTDKELALSSDRLISDHIRPAAYALADNIDTALAGLYKDIPWVSPMSATPALADLTAIRKIQFNNKNPMNDGLLNFMISGNVEAAYLNALQAAGQQANTQDPALRNASIGRLSGYDVFANQNTPLHTSGVAADAVGTVDGVNAKGATTLAFSGVTAGITWKIGDSFSIAGHTQRYVATADGTDADGSAASITFAPGLEKATAGAEVITLTLTGAAKAQNLAFHRNAFALVMAPLPTIGNELGARISSVADPKTGLALRARMYYVGNSSEVHVAMDVLYGIKTLDRNLAVRGYEA